jgi:hypothetical protein
VDQQEQKKIETDQRVEYVSYDKKREEPLRQAWKLSTVCTKRGSNYVIKSDAHESNGPNVSISRGFSSINSKIYLAVTTEIDLSLSCRRIKELEHIHRM